MGSGGPVGRVRTALGRAAARNRPGHRALEVSKARCLPAATRRHAGFPSRGTIAVVGAGRRTSKAIVLRVTGGSAASLGPSRGVPDRAAAARGAAAPGAQPPAFAGRAARRQGPHREREAAAGMDEGASAHTRGSRAGAVVPEGRRFSPEYRLNVNIV